MSKHNFTSGNNSNSNTVSPPAVAHNSTLKLQITDEAFCKFKYMRDHKEMEVAMYGITKPDDPLFVTDFALVKQKVNSVSADIDPEGLADHITKYLNLGINPINSERIWCHTHPMTGAGSANPSGKDMATWNHEDNSKKNFFVMMILSKSGEITCRLRIRGNADKFVSGLNYPIDIDQTISVSIVPTESFNQRITACAAKYFTPEALQSLEKDAVSKFVLSHANVLDVFPEFLELQDEYKNLVSVDQPVFSQNYSVGIYSSGVRQKKIATATDVPDMAIMALDDCEDISVIKMGSTGMNSINSKYTDPNGKTLIQNDLSELQELFIRDYQSQSDDIAMAILGAIRGKTVSSNGTKFRVDLYPHNRESRAATAVGACLFWPQYQKLAKIINGFDVHTYTANVH